MKTRLLILALLSQFSTLFAQDLKQNFQLFTEYYSPEKLYLHTDKHTYLVGDTIWIKGYLENSSYVSKLEESNFIYAELYADTLINRVKIKRINGVFSGYITTTQKMEPRKYILRAYTTWMLNRDNNYLFNRQIEFIDPLNAPITQKEGVLKELNKANMSITQKFDRTPEFSVQFFPESGRYFPEKFATIAFKASFANGRHLKINGEILDNSGVVVSKFNDLHNGMGIIRFMPVKGIKYKARVTLDNGDSKMFDLPDYEESGAMINVVRINSNWVVKSSINGILSPLSCRLLVHNGSEIIYLSQLNKEETLVNLPDSLFSKGINHAVIIGSDNKILAERIFFSNQFKRESDFYVDCKDSRSGTKDKIIYSLSNKDKTGKLLKGDYSVTVYDLGLAPEDTLQDNIGSYMMLSSELTGKVFNPQQYFSTPSTTKERDLDLLLMVQGWRYYDISSIFESSFKTVQNGREYRQQIAGKVKGLFKDAKNSLVTVICPKLNIKSIIDMKNASTFLIDSLEHMNKTIFFFSANRPKGGTSSFEIVLNSEVFPPLNKYNYIPELDPISVVEKINKEYNNALLGDNGRRLKEVVLTARVPYKSKYSPWMLSNVTVYKDQVRTAAEISQYPYMNACEYIAREFPSLSCEYADGSMFLTTRRIPIKAYSGLVDPELEKISRHGMQELPGKDYLRYSPTVYINNIRVDGDELSRYMAKDIENIIYFSQHSQSAMLFSSIGALFITTNRFAKGRGVPTYITSEVSLGYQKPLKRYNPVYDNNSQEASDKPDNRSTILWLPALKQKEDGSYEIKMFSSSRNSKYLMVVEGVNELGEYVTIKKSIE